MALHIDTPILAGGPELRNSGGGETPPGRVPITLEGMLMKVYFCRHTADRLKRPLDIHRNLQSFNGAFNMLGVQCRNLGFQPELFVLAHLHAMPEDWCRKKLGKPYPLPHMLVARENAARDRYERFLKFVREHTPPEAPVEDEDSKLQNELYVWEALGKPTDDKTLEQMVDVGLISSLTKTTIISRYL